MKKNKKQKKTGRFSDCGVPSIFKTVPVNREFTLIDLFKFGEFVPQDLYFESLGISEQASNAPGQFH